MTTIVLFLAKAAAFAIPVACVKRWFADESPHQREQRQQHVREQARRQVEQEEQRRQFEQEEEQRYCQLLSQEQEEQRKRQQLIQKHKQLQARQQQQKKRERQQQQKQKHTPLQARQQKRARQRRQRSTPPLDNVLTLQQLRDAAAALDPPFSTAQGQWLPLCDIGRNGSSRSSSIKGFARYQCQSAACRGQRWRTAHGYSTLKQACKKCNEFVLPTFMWRNAKTTSTHSRLRAHDDYNDSGVPHDCGRCEACQLGRCVASAAADNDTAYENFDDDNSYR